MIIYLFLLTFFSQSVAYVHEEECLKSGVVISLDEAHSIENKKISEMFTSDIYKAFRETCWCLAPVLMCSKEMRTYCTKMSLFLIGVGYSALVSAFDIFLVPKIKLHLYRKALQKALKRRELVE